MREGFVPTAPPENLIASVRSSLETVRSILQDGVQNEETAAQIRQLEQVEQLLLEQEARLESVNRVLEEFNYSVAHELCAPLRRISGFTREVRQRWGDALDPQGLQTLDLILESSQQMNDLIDALMQVSRLAHVELQPEPVDLTRIADEIAAELQRGEARRPVRFVIESGLQANADATLVRTALGKLLGNAWKYSRERRPALIEVGSFQLEQGTAFYVRDNGIGFDMSHYGRLFHPFQRLHDSSSFPGHGIGLTAVKRIIERHGGQLWAEGSRGQGATFYFTL